MRRIDEEAKELVSGLLFDDLRALAIEKAMVTLRTHELNQAVAELNVTVELFPALGASNPEDVFTNRHVWGSSPKARRRLSGVDPFLQHASLESLPRHDGLFREGFV